MTTTDTNVDDVREGAHLMRVFRVALAELTEHDWTRTDAEALAVLVRGASRMTEFADEIGLSRAAVTTLCDRLEDRGLLERVRVRGDRRTLALTLTDAGHRLVEQAARHAVEAIAEADATIDAIVEGATR